MTIQQALVEYPYITGRIMAINKEINDILSNRHDTCVTAKLTGMPGSGQISNPTLQAVERIVDKIDTHVEKLAKKVNELIDAKEMVDSRLDRLNIQERRVIEYRYFQLKQWTDIQRDMNYSERTVYRIHHEALEAMKDDSKRQEVSVQMQFSV